MTIMVATPPNTLLSQKESNLRNFTVRMRSASFKPYYPIPLSATIELPSVYGSFLAERFLGKEGRSLSPSEFWRTNNLPTYSQQLNAIESFEARRLTLDKSQRTIQNLKLQDQQSSGDIGKVPAYPYDTLYTHVHYSPNLNVSTWRGLSDLVQASDEYAIARTRFQNRLVRHVNFLDSLYNSYAVEQGWTNAPGTTPVKISSGKAGNHFSIANGPFFTVGGLSYRIDDDSDRNSEDRDLFFTFGEIEQGIGQILNITYYNIGNKTLYFADVSFFWWDNFTFDNGDPLNTWISEINDFRILQQSGFAEPFTTSIRIDDTIAGFVSSTDSSHIDSPTQQIKQGSFGNDYILGTEANDILLGRSGNDT